MQNAFIAGSLIGFISPLVGVFLVVKRLSLIADALSHVTLSGIAAGLLLQSKTSLFAGFNPLYFGMFFSVIGSLFIERLRQLYRSYQEIAIPIILSSGTALGVVLISAGSGFNVDIAGYLFGSILTVTNEELVTTYWISGIVLLFIIIFYKELFSISFDEEHADLSGIPRRMINLLFIIIVALVISVAIRVVGILLISALITIPVAISLQLVNSFRQAIFWSVVFGEIAVFSGLFTAYYFNWASGGSIVLVSVFMLIVVIVAKRLVAKLHKSVLK